MRRDQVLPAVLGFLALILVVQLASKTYIEQRYEHQIRNPLLPGEALRASLYTLEGGRFEFPSGCWHALVGTPTCYWCRRLARNWDDPDRAPMWWVIEGGEDPAREFANEFGLPTDSVLAFRGRLAAFGVFATPTRVTLRGRNVIDMQVSPDELTVADANAICEGAPHAPGY